MNRCLLPDRSLTWDSLPWDTPCCSKPVISSKQSKQSVSLHLHINATLCWCLTCIRSSVSVGNFSGQSATLQETHVLTLSLCQSQMCLSLLALLRNFCRQKGHGIVLCALIWILKLACRIVHITFTTSETCACRANVCLTRSTCVSCSCCIITTGTGYLCSFWGVGLGQGRGWAPGCGDGWTDGCGTGLAAAGFLWCFLLWICSAFWSLRALLQRLHIKWLFLQWLNKSQVV